MKIKKLYLRNWCQHEDAEFEFGTGLVGIVGRNGAGKSNIIRGLVFGLTGYVTGKKSDYLRYGSSSGSVSVDFIEDSTQIEYRLVRNIHNSDIFLYRRFGSDFGVVSGKATKVREILADVIPISPDVAQQIFAVPQEELVSLLRATTSKRAEILQRIFDLQFFSRVRQKLLTILKDADQRARDLETKILLLRDQESAKTQFLSTFAYLPDRESIESGIRLLTKEHQELSRRLGAQKMREYLIPLMKSLTESLAEIEKGLSVPEPERPSDTPLEEWMSELSRLEGRIDETKALRKLLETAATTPAPETFDSDALWRLEQLQAEDSVRHTAARRHYEMIRGCGTSGTCPTCGQSVQWTDRDLAKAQSDAVNLRQSMEDRRAELDELRALQKRLDRQAVSYEKLWSEIQAADAGCTPESLQGTLSDVSAELDALLARAETVQQSVDSMRTWEEEYARWTQDQASLSSQKDTMTASLEEIMSNPAVSDPELVDKESVESRLNALTEQLEELKDKQLKRIQGDAYMAELESIRQDRISCEIELKATNPELRDQLHKVAEVFHAKNLPARVAFDIYRALSSTLNVYLEDLQSPFSVELQDSGDFVCVFENGMRQMADRLSGGEKMLLSVAFRLALHFVFSTEDTCGFIFLDEPTTFLDEQNRDALAKVLTALKTSPRCRDMQIFVVTHDELLGPIFNKVIQL